MKKLLFIFSVVVFASCEKKECVTITNVVGDPCCVKCFRNEKKLIEFWQKNAGKDLCQLCD
jgi:hypothetical protein